MVEFLTATPNLPFTIALTLLFAIVFLEILGLLIGMSVAELLDSLVPDTDLNLGPEGAKTIASSVFLTLLGWLLIGRVPVLILFILFLTAFGIIGLFLQSLLLQITGRLFSAWIVSLPAGLAALAVVKSVGGLFTRFMVKDETTAVSEATFIGKIATITLGRAKRGRPARAKLLDEYGQTHYVLVEPEAEEDTFEVGNMVVLIDRSGTIFRAVRWIE